MCASMPRLDFSYKRCIIFSFKRPLCHLVPLQHKWSAVRVESENELSVLLIKHAPAHTLVLLGPHRALCRVVNSICMCVLVLGAIIALTLQSADGE